MYQRIYRCRVYNTNTIPQNFSISHFIFYRIKQAPTCTRRVIQLTLLLLLLLLWFCGSKVLKLDLSGQFYTRSVVYPYMHFEVMSYYCYTTIISYDIGVYTRMYTYNLQNSGQCRVILYHQRSLSTP